MKDLAPGFLIPPWIVDEVSAEKMKTFAMLSRPFSSITNPGSFQPANPSIAALSTAFAATATALPMITIPTPSFTRARIISANGSHKSRSAWEA